MTNDDEETKDIEYDECACCGVEFPKGTVCPVCHNQGGVRFNDNDPLTTATASTGSALGCCIRGRCGMRRFPSIRNTKGHISEFNAPAGKSSITLKI